MKLTIIGAGGVRSPLLVKGILDRAEELNLTSLALMDIDEKRLKIMSQVSKTITNYPNSVKIVWTTDKRYALIDADFVITTFRVGGMEGRILDETIPLKYNILGQETTGPGGFAMAMRSIPVLFQYIELMKEVCPQAWIINFANPSGLLTQAALNHTDWRNIIGICDAPISMAKVAAEILGVPQEAVSLDYFGLNHLGWVRSVNVNGKNILPEFIRMMNEGLSIPDLHFPVDMINSLGMIPNEYLYYYYFSKTAVQNIKSAERTRGQNIALYNQELFRDLEAAINHQDVAELKRVYMEYFLTRGKSYMNTETGQEDTHSTLTADLIEDAANSGYVGVAMDAIKALQGNKPKEMILNYLNSGSIFGLDPEDVVEIPYLVNSEVIAPVRVGEIPQHQLGLIQQIKAYEKLTIRACVNNSYNDALMALVIHPLVADHMLAKSILDDLIAGHGDDFPKLG